MGFRKLAEADLQDIAALPFERALAELEEIVTRLERGSVPLEESIAIYERGEALKGRCEALLRDAEMRIEKITLGPGARPVGTDPLRRGVRGLVWRRPFAVPFLRSWLPEPDCARPGTTARRSDAATAGCS